MSRQLLSTITNMVYLFPTWSRDDTFKKSDMLWSYLLLALLFDFFTVVFKTYQTFWQHFWPPPKLAFLIPVAIFF